MNERDMPEDEDYNEWSQELSYQAQLQQSEEYEDDTRSIIEDSV